MKFLKGMVWGTLVSAGVVWIMSDRRNSKTWRKTGKKIARKIENMM